VNGQIPRRPGSLAIGIAFTLSALGSIGAAVVYALGGHPPLEGFLLGIALAGIGAGLVLWAKRFMPVGHYVEAREPLSSPLADREGAEASIEAGAAVLGRRAMVVRLLVGAVAALGVAALFPIRSLGTAPGRALLTTAWRRGRRAVIADGRLVQASEIVPGSVVTVFPEGHPGAADSQTLLIGLEPGTYRPLPGREAWAANDIVAYSKICTHAGCPVGLYQPDSHRLFCPCHQSVFDVLDGARPIDGPATRPLPQLPIAVDEEGYVVALSDFTEPVGPGYWDRP
jgi:ubiquinol-cytochrome c reductase iron-sulfur subunit